MFVDEKLIKEIEEFDNAFLDGVFAIDRKPGEARVKVRALWNYCQERGLETSELSSEEMEKFLQYKKESRVSPSTLFMHRITKNHRVQQLH